MKTNYVLVDLENVQIKNIDLLNNGPFRIKVFLGANQAKIPVEMARALQQLGPNAEYIQIEGSGKNALDFHIAYFIGRLAAGSPDAGFYVISKDTGFDPLLKYLKTENVPCHRYTSIADIPLVKAADARSAPVNVDAVIDDLAKRKASKPRTLRTLRSTIKARFKLSDEALDVLIDQLKERPEIRLADGKVHYELP